MRQARGCPGTWARVLTAVVTGCMTEEQRGGNRCACLHGTEGALQEVKEIECGEAQHSSEKVTRK